jgi:DNA-binding transcriptional regulator GbsR (MarR family)
MALNIFKNFRTVYYNCLTNFYLLFNTFFPYYDDVVISLQKEALHSLNIDDKRVKKNRLLQFISEMHENSNKYKVIIDDSVKTIHFVEVDQDQDEFEEDEKVLDNEICTSSEEDIEDKKTL